MFNNNDYKGTTEALVESVYTDECYLSVDPPLEANFLIDNDNDNLIDNDADDLFVIG